MLLASERSSDDEDSRLVPPTTSRKKLDLNCAAGRIGLLVFDGTEARIAFQIYSADCRFSKPQSPLRVQNNSRR